MPGQALRLAPFHRDHVDVDVAVVAGGEGDVLAVGSEMRVLLLAGMRGQPPGAGPIGIGHPDVVGVDERDLPLGDRRRRQQPGVGRVDGNHGLRSCNHGDEEAQAQPKYQSSRLAHLGVLLLAIAAR